MVHINSPSPDRAWMTLAALEAGKHVACTVPTLVTGTLLTGEAPFFVVGRN